MTIMDIVVNNCAKAIIQENALMKRFSFVGSIKDQ